MKRARKPYKIIGAYDSETTNIETPTNVYAFPILHQLGIIDKDVIELDAQNVEVSTKVYLYRHVLDLYEKLDTIANTVYDYVPVICCHNLSFDMYGLSSWFSRHNVRVLAKSSRKPITFTVQDDSGNPRLVLWDTLVFSGQSLERMGIDCGYQKGVGEWDYNLIRTPETPLTDDELDYAKRDIYTLLAWLGWWLRRNPDIEPSKLGLNVVTKTGVVRERRRVRFDQLRGNNSKYNVGRYWLYINRTESFKSDDELYTCMECTRGGFTFCASSNASVPFDLSTSSRRIIAFDATSQHPAQMVSHLYPVRFCEASVKELELAFSLISKMTLNKVLSKWHKPFPVAFYACYEFENLRPKAGSVFARDGIFPLASARYKNAATSNVLEDNGDKQNQDENRRDYGYCDVAESAKVAFGKIESADSIQLYITELTAWEICQCYDFDSVKAVHGYITGRFVKPTDMSIISVMQFYKAKNSFKDARKAYYKTHTITNGAELKALGIAPAIVAQMESGTLPVQDVESTYLSLKADLNALFGIECSNEYRRNTILASDGIQFEGDFGICNKPKNPKAWYQFGQRIVGWSRIAQVCVMLLCKEHAITYINGDTDSIKMLAEKSDLQKIERDLKRLSDAIDAAKDKVCMRVKTRYPAQYDALEDIGHYVFEFESDRFCASWNKAYCMQDADDDGIRRFTFTLAGVPTKKRVSAVSSFIGIDGYADRLYKLGYTFEQICNILLGYNVTLANNVIRLNARKFPQWGDMVSERVTDYLGNKSRVIEPSALALYPMTKTLNDTLTPENDVNARIAKSNNASVNLEPIVVHAKGITRLDGVLNA